MQCLKFSSFNLTIFVAFFKVSFKLSCFLPVAFCNSFVLRFQLLCNISDSYIPEYCKKEKIICLPFGELRAVIQARHKLVPVEEMLMLILSRYIIKQYKIKQVIDTAALCLPVTLLSMEAVTAAAQTVS